MRVNKAKRRWMRWCRYVTGTGTKANHRYSAGIHAGHAKAHQNVMFARRWAPIGGRAPYYPKWAAR